MPKEQSSSSKWYPTEDEKHPLIRRFKPRAAKLRSSITPGTVLIVLSGRFRGKRVVFLKQLRSGLLLVTGPYKVNGVPLRRINQAYVIATSTKVDVSGVAVPAHVDDAYFKRVKTAKATKTEEGFFKQQEVTKVELSEQRKADQKAVDASVMAAVAKVPALSAYLNAHFSLGKHERPHDMVF
eukprot:CAMPEP_0196769082 /NCGR_PEP_ID=MMETSP1104-20130614/317_1 /TAXON_ID=33652 /ORGANISM="Cafeteria sp., Strain Caron Lab Isolate" /LENGTH=181 /DNA_ID=CAMNT_0042139167 /DNA_START=39 /DNA_END=584 /DNA_ORIENTATION=+